MKGKNLEPKETGNPIKNVCDLTSPDEQLTKSKRNKANQMVNHNRNEKLRKARLNSLIMKLRDMLPEISQKESKNTILEKVCDYMCNLKETIDKYEAGNVDEAKDQQISALKDKVEALEEKNVKYQQMLKSVKINNFENWSKKAKSITSRLMMGDPSVLDLARNAQKESSSSSSSCGGEATCDVDILKSAVMETIPLSPSPDDFADEDEQTEPVQTTPDSTTNCSSETSSSGTRPTSSPTSSTACSVDAINVLTTQGTSLFLKSAFDNISKSIGSIVNDKNVASPKKNNENTITPVSGTEDIDRQPKMPSIFGNSTVGGLVSQALISNVQTVNSSGYPQLVQSNVAPPIISGIIQTTSQLGAAGQNLGCISSPVIQPQNGTIIVGQQPGVLIGQQMLGGQYAVINPQPSFIQNAQIFPQLNGNAVTHQAAPAVQPFIQSFGQNQPVLPTLGTQNVVQMENKNQQYATAYLLPNGQITVVTQPSSIIPVSTPTTDMISPVNAIMAPDANQTVFVSSTTTLNQRIVNRTIIRGEATNAVSANLSSTSLVASSSAPSPLAVPKQKRLQRVIKPKPSLVEVTNQEVASSGLLEKKEESDILAKAAESIFDSSTGDEFVNSASKPEDSAPSIKRKIYMREDSPEVFKDRKRPKLCTTTGTEGSSPPKKLIVVDISNSKMADIDEGDITKNISTVTCVEDKGTKDTQSLQQKKKNDEQLEPDKETTVQNNVCLSANVEKKAMDEFDSLLEESTTSTVVNQDITITDSAKVLQKDVSLGDKNGSSMSSADEIVPLSEKKDLTSTAVVNSCGLRQGEGELTLNDQVDNRSSTSISELVSPVDVPSSSASSLTSTNCPEKSSEGGVTGRIENLMNANRTERNIKNFQSAVISNHKSDSTPSSNAEEETPSLIEEAVTSRRVSIEKTDATVVASTIPTCMASMGCVNISHPTVDHQDLPQTSDVQNNNKNGTAAVNSSSANSKFTPTSWISSSNFVSSTSSSSTVNSSANVASSRSQTSCFAPPEPQPSSSSAAGFLSISQLAAPCSNVVSSLNEFLTSPTMPELPSVVPSATDQNSANSPFGSFANLFRSSSPTPADAINNQLPTTPPTTGFFDSSTVDTSNLGNRNVANISSSSQQHAPHQMGKASSGDTIGQPFNVEFATEPNNHRNSNCNQYDRHRFFQNFQNEGRPTSAAEINAPELSNKVIQMAPCSSANRRPIRNSPCSLTHDAGPLPVVPDDGRKSQNSAVLNHNLSAGHITPQFSHLSDQNFHQSKQAHFTLATNANAGSKSVAATPSNNVKGLHHHPHQLTLNKNGNSFGTPQHNGNNSLDIWHPNSMQNNHPSRQPNNQRPNHLFGRESSFPYHNWNDDNNNNNAPNVPVYGDNTNLAACNSQARNRSSPSTAGYRASPVVNNSASAAEMNKVANVKNNINTYNRLPVNNNNIFQRCPNSSLSSTYSAEALIGDHHSVATATTTTTSNLNNNQNNHIPYNIPSISSNNRHSAESLLSTSSAAPISISSFAATTASATAPSFSFASNVASNPSSGHFTPGIGLYPRPRFPGFNNGTLVPPVCSQAPQNAEDANIPFGWPPPPRLPTPMSVNNNYHGRMPNTSKQHSNNKSRSQKSNSANQSHLGHSYSGNIYDHRQQQSAVSAPLLLSTASKSKSSQSSKSSNKAKKSNNKKQQKSFNNMVPGGGHSSSLEEINLSGSIFETNRSITPYFGVPNFSPPKTDTPTYLPNNLLNTASHRPPHLPADESIVPTAPLFPSRQSNIGLNFNQQQQTSNFNPNSTPHQQHLVSSQACIAPSSTTTTVSYSNSHFHVSNLFPDINGTTTSSLSAIKFNHPNHFVPASHGTPSQVSFDPSLQQQHHHQQSQQQQKQATNAASSGNVYGGRIHHSSSANNGMSINSILGGTPNSSSNCPPSSSFAHHIGPVNNYDARQIQGHGHAQVVSGARPPHHHPPPPPLVHPQTPFTNVLHSFNFSMQDH